MVHSRKKELSRSFSYWQGSVSLEMLDKGPQFFSGSWPPPVVCQTCFYSIAACFIKACKPQDIRDSLPVSGGHRLLYRKRLKYRSGTLSPLPQFLVRNKSQPSRVEGDMRHTTMHKKGEIRRPSYLPVFQRPLTSCQATPVPRKEVPSKCPQ